MFVGLPVCACDLSLFLVISGCSTALLGRNQEYLDLAIRFTIDVIKDRALISFIPESLKMYVCKDNLDVRSV